MMKTDIARGTALEGAIVYIVDDDSSLREALSSLFRSVGLEVRLYGSPREFTENHHDEACACLILDIRLPGLSGLDFQVQLADLGIRIPVILISGHGDIPMSVRGMKAGAVDFLTKPFRDQDMLDAVYAALRTDYERRNKDAQTAAINSCYASLSPREKQVMALVTAGRLNKQVAGDLGLSEITVKIHRGSVMRKMGVRTLPDLVRMASALKLHS